MIGFGRGRGMVRKIWPTIHLLDHEHPLLAQSIPVGGTCNYFTIGSRGERGVGKGIVAIVS